jgi:hypothetical protein
VRDTISQLGERGAVRAKFAGRGVFIPVGVGLWGIAYRLVGSNGHGALLAFCIGVGYVVAGAFPCDPGLPVRGSWRQNVHDAGGVVEYAGGAYALLRLAPADGLLHWLFYATAAFLPVAAASAFIPGLKRVRGLIQRCAEILLFAALWYVSG